MRPFNGTFHFQNLYYTFLTRVDIGIILSEYVRQRKTNTTYTWNLKNKWTKSNINTDNRLVVTRGEEVVGEGDMGEGDHLYGGSWQLESLWRQRTQMSNYGKKICLPCRRSRFNPWVRMIPWRREWLPTPVLLPGDSHAQRSLLGYSPSGCKELDPTEQLTQFPHTWNQYIIYQFYLNLKKK